MRNDFLDQFYTIDSDTGEYIIEIALKNYDDVFNSWDSSVYNIRDLDSSLKSFLEECSSDISLRKNIILRFNIKEEEKNTGMEETIKKGISNYFLYRFHVTNKKFYIRKKRTVLYVLLSAIFASSSFYLRSIIEDKIIYEFLLLSLTVGGWVFLWEAFSLIFLQSSELWKKRKQYQRLANAPVLFRYSPAKS